MLPAHHATRIFRPLAVREVISRLGSCRPNASANSCWTSSIARSLAGVVLQRTSVASLKRLRFVLQGPPLKGDDYARSKHLSEGTSEALIGRRPGQGGRHGNDRVERRTTRGLLWKRPGAGFLASRGARYGAGKEKAGAFEPAQSHPFASSPYTTRRASG